MLDCLGGAGKRGEATGIATAVDHIRLRPAVQNMTTVSRAPTASRWPRFHAMGSSNHFDEHFSDEDFSYAPTPCGYGRTDSESSFHEYRSTSSPIRNEVPRTSTACLRPRAQTEKLAFFQLSEWDPAKVYNDGPPTCLRATVGWKVTLNGKPFHENTEQDVVLTLASYWELILQPKVDKVVTIKRNQRRNMTLQDTKLVVSVTQRLEPKLILQYGNDEEIDWPTVEDKFVEWGEFFRIGKRLRVDLSVNYDDREGAGQQATTGSSKSVDKRSTRSTTQRMLTDLHAEQEASGGALVYTRLYQLFECPSLSCNSPNYCWVDPMGKVHRKITTRLLGKVIKYVQDGNTVDTHSDVPEGLQAEIRMEDQQRQVRKRKAGASSPSESPRVHITNVIPGQSEKGGTSASPLQTVSVLDIPGYRDDAVQDYVRYLQGKVRSKKHREEFRKCGDIVLDNLSDLEEVRRKLTPKFFTERNVEESPANQFIRDIPAFVQCQTDSVN